MKNLWPIFAVIVAACSDPKDNISADDLGPATFEVDESSTRSFDFSEETNQLTAWDERFLDAGLVNIQEQIPEILVELKYSTTDNFFGRDVYDDLENAYLQPEVVNMMEKAFLYLQEKDSSLTFLVYDGVRPRAVQQILWDNLDKPDSLKPLYVADPKIGGLHNYGVAVDLTLAHKDSGEPLDMGTKYDYFGYAAYPDRENQMLREGKITKQHIENRRLLREVMKQAGFHGIGSEWWHFNAYTRKQAAEKFEIVE
ncbi:M15 family metallopeptidase [Litoribacter ruber]|uniref:M15 family metallopeptidase n=1 Tax=Litoribacter ruber TaxID=702568 RepID=UPI001BDA6A3C|nr:M15 family metallopeptidase [Litoribacter ruber]MBT0812805.1 M15 family metallopeptidase [Litoribacter ruber]